MKEMLLTVYSTVKILALWLDFGQFDKPVAYRLRSPAKKLHLWSFLLDFCMKVC